MEFTLVAIVACLAVGLWSMCDMLLAAVRRAAKAGDEGSI